MKSQVMVTAGHLRAKQNRPSFSRFPAAGDCVILPRSPLSGDQILTSVPRNCAMSTFQILLLHAYASGTGDHSMQRSKCHFLGA